MIVLDSYEKRYFNRCIRIIKIPTNKGANSYKL